MVRGCEDLLASKKVGHWLGDQYTILGQISTCSISTLPIPIFSTAATQAHPRVREHTVFEDEGSPQYCNLYRQPVTRLNIDDHIPSPSPYCPPLRFRAVLDLHHHQHQHLPPPPLIM